MNVGLRTVSATRYVTPLREGGSLPGLVEADDSGLYVVKFRGAGQGPRALAAEVIAGELGRALGLPVPEQVLVEIDPALGLAEPDPEIQELIVASAGANLGVDFLPGAAAYSPGARVEAGSGARRRRRVVRRVPHERRPHAAQPEPAAVARPPLADRPWRRALSRITAGCARPSTPRGRFPQIAEHVLLPVRRLDRGGRRAPRAADRPRACSRRSSRWCRPNGSPASGRAPTSTTSSGASRPPRAFVEEAEHARDAAPSAFSYAIVRVVPHVERGEGFNAGVVLFCRQLDFLGGARRARRAPPRRAGARGLARLSCRPHLEAIVRIAAGRPGGGADRARCRRPSASAGWSPRRARSSSHRRCTPGCPRIRGRRWTRCSPSSSADRSIDDLASLPAKRRPRPAAAPRVALRDADCAGRSVRGPCRGAGRDAAHARPTPRAGQAPALPGRGPLASATPRRHGEAADRARQTPRAPYLLISPAR